MPHGITEIAPLVSPEDTVPVLVGRALAPNGWWGKSAAADSTIVTRVSTGQLGCVSDTAMFTTTLIFHNNYRVGSDDDRCSN